MIPSTISERLMFNTVRLETNDGSSGTGFFFTFKFGNLLVPILVTNKHVVNNNETETVTFFLHLKGKNSKKTEKYQIPVETNWIFHSNKDLCFTFVNHIFEEIKLKTDKEVYYISAEENLIPNKEILNNLSALEEIVMVGYPNGLWDEINNYPIFRKGYTSSHPSYDFNEKGIALADIAAFPGSSGSPIYILNEGSYRDKNGNIFIGQSRMIFLGILFAGPTIPTKGEVKAIDIPVQQKIISETNLMINLGYYIRSNELLEFKLKIEELLKNNILNS